MRSATRISAVALLFALSACGGCDDENPGGDGDNSFTAPDGTVCADATPCGDCDQDCRLWGNPFGDGSGGGGDVDPGGSGGGGTGYDGEACTLNSDCRGMCGGAGTCEGFGGGGYDGDSCLSDGDCRGSCGAEGLCTAGGGAPGGDGTGGGGTGGDNNGTGGGGTGGDNNGTPNSGIGGGIGGSSDTSTCLDLQIELELAIPTVSLLIDQSGSMEDPFGGGLNRWEAAYESLMDPDAGLVQELQGAFRFGLSLYSNEPPDSECPLLADVRPDLNNYTPINTVFAQAEPLSDTPTGESILGTLRQFDVHPDQGRKIILLATDGEPDTCAVPNPQEGQPEAVSAAQTAFGQGIETIVLSVGDEVGAPHLEDMANAGVGLPIGGAQQAPYYTANDPQQLTNEMRTIIDSARSCIFRVQGGVIDPGLLDRSTVTVDGAAIAYGDPNGWIYHQNQATCQGAKQCIELQGMACEGIQDGGDHTILGDFLCAYYDPENPPINGGGGGGDVNADPNNGNGGGGGGATEPPPCRSPGDDCTFDGDCCTGVCSANTGGICLVN